MCRKIESLLADYSYPKTTAPTQGEKAPEVTRSKKEWLPLGI
jgi:hypothetical protein